LPAVDRLSPTLPSSLLAMLTKISLNRREGV
jgi:hypothetical protein